MESVPEKFIMAIISQFEQESMREASKLSSLWGDFVEDLLLNQKEYELALVPIKRSDDSEELYYYMCPRNNGLNPVLFENLNVAAHYVKIWHVCLYEEMPSSLNFTLASPSVIPLIKEVLVNNFLPINFTSCLPATACGPLLNILSYLPPMKKIIINSEATLVEQVWQRNLAQNCFKEILFPTASFKGRCRSARGKWV